MLGGPDEPVLLRGRGVGDPALRTILRVLALSGPVTPVEVVDEPYEHEESR